MSLKYRSLSFWIFFIFIALSIVLMLTGQTMSVFNYDLAVDLRLQESPEQVGEFGIQINRAFGIWGLIYLILRGEILVK